MPTVLVPPPHLKKEQPALDPDALIKEARERQRRRRRRLSLLGALLVAGIGGLSYGIVRALSDGHNPTTPCPTASCADVAVHESGSATRTPLYGFSRVYAAPSSLGRVSPATLKLVGKSLHVPEDLNPGAVAPDGTRLLLLKMSYPTRRDRGEPSLSIVDLRGMRVEVQLQPQLNADLARRQVVAAIWPTANQILVVAQRFGRARWPHGPRVVTAQSLIAINPSTAAIDWTRTLNSTLTPIDSGTVGNNVILLFQPPNKPLHEQATIISASPSGSLHSTRIPLTPGGYGNFPARLVVTSSPTGQHAYALTAGGNVYSFNPTTGRATVHHLPTPTNAPSTSPPDLLPDAAAIGNNIVVSSFFPRPSGAAAAGIYLINPTTWTVRLLDPTTPAWFTVGNSLVTYTNAGQFRLASSWQSKGTGIRIYNQNGSLRRHLYGTQAFDYVLPGPGFDIAVLPSQPNRTSPPHTPAQYRARNAAAMLHELLFNPTTGQSLGNRTEIGQLPALIRPTTPATHR